MMRLGERLEQYLAERERVMQTSQLTPGTLIRGKVNFNTNTLCVKFVSSVLFRLPVQRRELSDWTWREE